MNLAHQLLAAKLNIANGSDSADIRASLTTSDALLGEFSSTLPYNVAAASGIRRDCLDSPCSHMIRRLGNLSWVPKCQKWKPQQFAMSPDLMGKRRSYLLGVFLQVFLRTTK
jgi:hypothetical protein